MALRIGVVGAGVRGLQWLRDIASDPGCEEVFLVDSSAATLAAIDFPSVPTQRRFTALDEALGSVGCDAVVVATPAADHPHACATAISRGVAVMVEKPFTTDLRSAAALVLEAERRGVVLLVAQNYRYMRAWHAATRLVADDALGRVGYVSGHYYRVPHEMVPSLAVMEQSVLWGMGVHHLDAIRTLLGQRVTGVFADDFTAPYGKLPRGASIHVLLEFESGVHGSYSATYESSGHQYFERGQEFYGRIIGEKATLHIFHRWLILCANGRLPRLIRRGPRRISEERLLLQELEGAVVRGTLSKSSGRENLQTMAVLEACRRSSREQLRLDPQQLLARALSGGDS